MKTSQQKTKRKSLKVRRVNTMENLKLPCDKADPYREIKKEVRNILGISDAEHNEMIFKDGLRWLDEIPKDRRELVSQWKNNRRWWKWFTNEYYLIDQRFVKEMIISERYQKSRKEALSHYEQLHKYGYRLIWDQRPANKTERALLIKQSKKRNHG
jgi:hypothetical protein